MPNMIGTAVSMIQDPALLDVQAHDWSLLSDKENQPSHQYAWVRVCADVFRGDNRLQLVVIGGEQPQAIAPMIITDRFSRLECLGVDELYEPTDFPHSDPGALKSLAEALLALRRPIYLKRVLSESPAIEALRLASKGRALVITRPVAPYPWIPLQNNWSLSTSRLSALRRASRRAEEYGKVSFEIRSPEPDRVLPMLNEAFFVEASGWKARSGSSLVQDSARRKFYEGYAVLAARKGILRLCFMRIDGRAVAMQFAVECNNRFWLLKVGFDETYSRCSPGNLLMRETISYATERGLSSYEFLGTAAPWTQMWTNLLRSCVSLRIYPDNVKGIAALVHDAGSYAWQKLNSRH